MLQIFMHDWMLWKECFAHNIKIQSKLVLTICIYDKENNWFERLGNIDDGKMHQFFCAKSKYDVK